MNSMALRQVQRGLVVVVVVVVGGGVTGDWGGVGWAMQRAPQWRQLWREACVSSLTAPPTRLQFCAVASKVSPNASAPLEPQQALGDRGRAGVGARRHIVPNLEQAARVLASA